MLLRLFFLLTFSIICTTEMMAADVVDLSGKIRVGSLTSLSQSGAVLQTEQGEVEVASDQILKITFSESTGNSQGEFDLPIRVTATDHSELAGSSIKSDGRHLTVETATFGQLQFSPQKVKSILFSTLDETTRGQWKQLLQRETRDDLLVIKKKGQLDFLAGVVTSISEKSVNFLYEGDEIPVRRKKVFGIIHPNRFAASEQAKCRIETTTGDSLFVYDISLQDDEFHVQTGPSHSIKLKRSQIHLLDYSLGRIVYLSDLLPEAVEYTPYFDTVWEYQRDKTIDGSPLKLENKEYAKGLWIHSKTRLTYRLAGDFSRFQALLGIDDAVAKSGLGHVHVIVSADDKVLYEDDISALMPPKKIDLDVKGYRFLSLLVDFGEGLNIGDRLDLVEARIVK